uniref:Uncharacterized protein n=1 Tax=Macaca mulatta TaxID=9544 RepID=A0A5F7ZFE2_MACMU
DEELVEHCSKGDSCYAKIQAAFCPCPRDLWSFELERDDLGYLAEEISKQQSIQEEEEYKSLKNLQPDNVIEKKKHPFSGEKFKPAAEICISNEEPNVNHQDNGENVYRACQRPSWQSLLSQAWRPMRKKWFHRPRPETPCSMQPQDVVLCIPAAPAPAMAKRSQFTAHAVALEGASPKPWQLPCGGGPVCAQKSRIEVWEPLPTFQRIYGNA